MTKRTGLRYVANVTGWHSRTVAPCVHVKCTSSFVNATLGRSLMLALTNPVHVMNVKHNQHACTKHAQLALCISCPTLTYYDCMRRPCLHQHMLPIRTITHMIVEARSPILCLLRVHLNMAVHSQHPRSPSMHFDRECSKCSTLFIYSFTSSPLLLIPGCQPACPPACSHISYAFHQPYSLAYIMYTVIMLRHARCCIGAGRCCVHSTCIKRHYHDAQAPSR